jgi:Endoplasmic reticulum vesicle transporter
VVSLDLIDVTGELQRDITHNVVKSRLTATGEAVAGPQIAELRNDIDKLNEQRASGYCGSCYGGEPPEGGCCNSCDAVREAYTRRGWSFGNPSSIEQVWILSFLSSHRVQTSEWGGHSALRNTGPTTSKSSHPRVATSPVSYE